MLLHKVICENMFKNLIGRFFSFSILFSLCLPPLFLRLFLIHLISFCSPLSPAFVSTVETKAGPLFSQWKQRQEEGDYRNSTRLSLRCLKRLFQRSHLGTVRFEFFSTMFNILNEISLGAPCMLNIPVLLSWGKHLWNE